MDVEGRHPIALFFLYLFRCLAIATYLLCGFFSSSYVFSVSSSPPLEAWNRELIPREDRPGGGAPRARLLDRAEHLWEDVGGAAFLEPGGRGRHELLGV